VGVRLSGEGGQRRWCGFNALILAQGRRQRDETLLEYEADAASSS
jgi:hypothetical protein